MTQTFAALIRGLREVHGIDRKTLSARIGVSPCTLTNWERGTHEPHLWVVPLLQQVFRLRSITHTKDGWQCLLPAGWIEKRGRPWRA